MNIKDLPHYVPFRVFVAITCEQMNLKIAPHQVKIADWMEETRGKNVRLFMGCRNISKSFFTSCYVAWELAMDQHQSFLVVSASHDVAKSTLNHVSQLIETPHPVCTDIAIKLQVAADPNSDANDPNKYRKKRKPIWNKQELRIPGSKIREPNVRIKSAYSSLTGLHADHVILDDVEARESVSTENRLKFIKNALLPMLTSVSTKSKFYIGTPWTEDSIYRDLEERIPQESVLKLPYTEKLWPERYTPEYMEEVHANYLPFEYQSQYLLQYVSQPFGNLDAGLLKTYSEEWDLSITRYNVRPKTIYNTFIGDKEIIDVACYWDSAKGYVGGDRSVLAAVAMDHENNFYIHRLVILPPVTSDGGYDPQFEKMLQHLQYMNVSRVYVEEFGHSMLSSEFEKYAKRAGKPLTCTPITRGINKRKFIQDRIEPTLNHGKLWIHDSIDRNVINRELNDFPQGSTDDCLDAISGAIEELRNPRGASSLSPYPGGVRRDGRKVGSFVPTEL